VKKTLQWLLACLIAFCLWGGGHFQPARADMMYPDYPVRPAKYQRNPQPTAPIYSVAAGMVALTLSGSFAMLYVMRKRNGK
jgi:hypothetical protein